MNRGLMPPQSTANPYQGRTWTYCIDVVPTTSGAVKAAIAHGADHAAFIMKHAFFEADLSVPASPTAAAWSATASLLGQRVKVHRTGTRADGGDWAVSDLIRFRFRLDPAMPPNVRKVVDAMVQKYSAYITVGPFDWQGGPQALAASAPRKRPAAAGGEPAVRKRPARR
eukprot:1581592-Pyramimonas_sp.AAC.2